MKTIMGVNVLEAVAVEYTNDGRELVMLEDGTELDEGFDEDGVEYLAVYDEQSNIVGYTKEGVE